ncbi:lysine N(6)-hydroxylase/L-ornithine N(5)-oxygenase family protein [Paraoerskovia marina]|uniref:lysine N(6)-hydroxylase/L-ornithine N(5)-oxygenase family protein n=1 Tax=Paraoerskovia marina TaxID=545619 RepID=UPI0005BC3A77|nr:SidA/IucD/PvdA family monooxygenase [Paraoerskovia marina]
MTTTHDLIGIGIGPFNLGLAALADPLDLDAVFLDARDEFRWHPGMMLEGATIQVPFLADLVTMADPTSRFSFLNHLKATGRLYPFYIRESFYPLRAEYDAYCRWVAGQLGTLRWGREVVSVEHDGEAWVVRSRVASSEIEVRRARHLVLGTGTAPTMPAPLRALAEAQPGAVLHSADFLPRRADLVASGSVTVVGSGQSAAEIYRDLLEEVHEHDYRLDWVTRSPRFFPMEYTKLTLEMTSPEYADHFHALPMETRDRLGRDQRSLYKGISGDLVDDIYDTLYRKSVTAPVPTTLLTDTAVVGAGWDAAAEECVLRLRHAQTGQEVERRTQTVVAATGYAPRVPAFLDPVRDRICWDARGRFAVARDYTIDAERTLHVLNAEDHTHGITAPDLGFAAWRNSVVLASVLGREVYPVERRIAFQEFGLPADGADASDGTAPAGAGRGSTEDA